MMIRRIMIVGMALVGTQVLAQPSPLSMSNPYVHPPGVAYAPNLPLTPKRSLVFNAGAKTVFKIDNDGHMSLGEGVDADEGAKAFMLYLEKEWNAAHPGCPSTK